MSQPPQRQAKDFEEAKTKAILRRKNSTGDLTGKQSKSTLPPYQLRTSTTTKLASDSNSTRNLAEESGPWMVGGDFNKILHLSERKGGGVPRHHSMEELGQTIFDCGLMDIGFEGSQFTWTDKRIWQRLDRILFSMEWLDQFHSTKFEDIFERIKLSGAGVKDVERRYDMDPTDSNLITLNRPTATKQLQGGCCLSMGGHSVYGVHQIEFALIQAGLTETQQHHRWFGDELKGSGSIA
ncbi:hypothetical protein Salat_1370600 [Sesamum alatum]|uniref:Uncharacterized protein n=1 Tax=Sesamum alatum TaxID=300844 RepID=A0AAE2CKZ8_9LAMI|nr:hypothetical protein Salat_1370600 [Sesamum alatum]